MIQVLKGHITADTHSEGNMVPFKVQQIEKRINHESGSLMELCHH